MITVSGGEGGEPFLPPWMASTTVWWLQGEIADESYVRMIQYLVDVGVITGLVP